MVQLVNWFDLNLFFEKVEELKGLNAYQIVQMTFSLHSITHLG